MNKQPLSELHKRFCEEYAKNGGNGRAAYQTVRPQSNAVNAANAACIILKKPEAQEYLAELGEQAKTANIADISECLIELTKFIRDDKSTPSVKLKALDMRLKTLGAFIDKKEISSDVVINVSVE